MRAFWTAVFLIWGAISWAQPKVVVSIRPIHSLTAVVMEGRGTPQLLWTGVQSPHGGALRPSEMRALREADLVVWVGPTLEGALARPLEGIEREKVLTLLEALPTERLLEVRRSGRWGEAHSHSHQAREANVSEEEDLSLATLARFDPHVWLDPLLGAEIGEHIARRLEALDPAGAERYRENAARLRRSLLELDAELQERLAPVRTVPYLVFHDAYQYFERRYGLNAVGAVALDPERQPGARRLAELRRWIAQAGVRCLFLEPQFSPRVVRVLSEGLEVAVGTLDPIGTDLKPGPELYPQLLRHLAKDLRSCLESAERR
ncbi:MAG: zinc ABC transporter substrate-binding protein [Candidatus Poribacteria bacterium]|nr:MAG: zinc ABC transporter substrate-binding protein [Candidatus Poribacteria bacterium]